MPNDARVIPSARWIIGIAATCLPVSCAAQQLPFLVADINPGSGYADPRELTNVNGVLFFRACDPTNGCELWLSDGRAEGTRLVKDINPGSGDSDPGALTDVNGVLFFRACDVLGQCGLWRSDGTDAGTVLVKAFPNLGHTEPPFPHTLTNVNGILFSMAAISPTAASSG